MNSTMIALLGIYLFILVGFMAKSIFKERIDNQSINILSLYFLQPFLMFWGILSSPINSSHIQAPLIYLIVIITVLVINILLTARLFSDVKERSIATVAALIGNTGNLGIPLGIALFGEASIIYTTLINLANVIILYTFGTYFYSRGSFSVKESLKNIFKLPLLWSTTIAITLNFNGFIPSDHVAKTLQMGAYSSIVLQLVLFGIYMQGIKISTINRFLITWVSSIKFIILPLVAFFVMSFFEISDMIKWIIILELTVPIAVNNVNLSALYNCKERDVTALVFITSLIFLIFAVIFSKYLI